VRVEKLCANFDIRLQHTFFPLHPETPRDGQTLEALFAGRGINVPAAQKRIAQLMHAEGLPYGNRTMTYNSRLAQELGAWAETQPDGQRIHNALYQAYFVRNTNLADTAELLQIVAALDFPVDETRQVLTARTFAPAVDLCWSRAQSLGITSVPTFVCGQNGIAGAVDYQQLEPFVVRAGARPRR